MKSGITIKGMDELIKTLDPGPVTQKSSEVVRRYAAEVQSGAVRRVPVKTGFLKRSITAPFISDGGLTATITAWAEYAPYVELGTRFKAAKPFMRPSIQEVMPRFMAALANSIGGK